jgi:uncharacterized RDD family membrane protein YckC
MSNIDTLPASLFKRLAAIVYDALLALAMAMGLVLLPASILITFAHMDTHSGFYIIGILLWFYLVMLGFFGWFWTHGGQTLGMRAWRLKLVAEDGGAVSWKAAWVRFTLGLPAWTLVTLGLYYLDTLPMAGPAMLLAGAVWVLLDQRPDGWRERLSGTRVVALPKPARPTR